MPRVLLIIIIIIASCTFIHADTVLLKSGKSIEGKIIWIDNNTLQVRDRQGVIFSVRTSQVLSSTRVAEVNLDNDTADFWSRVEAFNKANYIYPAGHVPGENYYAFQLSLSNYLGDLDPEQVSGYFRSSGTYVDPYLRTRPDGIPFNNFGFPGNYNPNTGQITGGNPETYLQRYYNKQLRSTWNDLGSDSIQMSGTSGYSQTYLQGDYSAIPQASPDDSPSSKMLNSPAVRLSEPGSSVWKNAIRTQLLNSEVKSCGELYSSNASALLRCVADARSAHR